MNNSLNKIMKKYVCKNVMLSYDELFNVAKIKASYTKENFEIELENELECGLIKCVRVQNENKYFI